MDDCMTFPDTVEEFMDQYKVVDTDGIYMSKGAELVPIFRMRQWFEHLPSAQPEGINYVKFSEENYEKIAEQLRKIPIVLTLSEPEIIRCRECKWYLEKYGACSCHQWDVSDGCQYAEVDCEMDFCSYAERKEQDDG